MIWEEGAAGAAGTGRGAAGSKRKTRTSQTVMWGINKIDTNKINK